MADLAPHQASGARWIDNEPATRQRWHALVVARRHHLGTMLDTARISGASAQSAKPAYVTGSARAIRAQL
ncbi:hypothetical protein ACOZCG_30795 [Streptomyces pseudogriseolus]|uniref:hypothetical protein n=1 Tax=Streptomyces pseudogriseolus TaxID=36817 RepID=UPI003FA26E60